jgi:hypothetical protein
LTAIANASKPLQSNAVGVGFVLLSGETYTALQWAGFFVVLTALFAFEKKAQPAA